MQLEGANMQRLNAQEITLGEWNSRVIGVARTLSASARPNSAFLACTYESDLGQFLAYNTYMVRFTDPKGSRLVQYDDPAATAILIRDFLLNEVFVQSVVNDWYKPDLGEVEDADLITLHCSGCDRHIVIDGVHRTTWLGSRGKNTALIRVTELSGLSWPDNTPDMSVVCNCRPAA